MNRGLLLKALRESWLATLSFGIGLALAEAGLAYAYLKFQDEISELIAQVFFVQQFVNALLDSDMAGPISPEMLAPWPGCTRCCWLSSGACDPLLHACSRGGSRSWHA